MPRHSLVPLINWRPSSTGCITAIEMHTGGEPLRVFTSGLPPVEGLTVLEKRRYFRGHYDHIRKATMWEPRGHADMYGAVLSASTDADFDVFFLHNEGYSTMCGHAIIALTTLVIEAGLISPEPTEGEGSVAKVSFEVPAGRILARARLENGRVREVRFRNVPSFLYRADVSVAVSGIGQVRCDIAYGGAFYALVDADSLGLELTPATFSKLVDYGRRIKLALMRSVDIEHPLEKDLSFLYGTIFTGRPVEAHHHSRNACIFADGELDRSPTGSGVSARAAALVARNALRIDERITIESILGSTMTVQAIARAQCGPFDAIIPEVGGNAYITGKSEFYIDSNDTLGAGFILR